MKLAVIYIPGLGDRRTTGQLKAVQLWRIYGVRPELFVVRWFDSEPWPAKLQRLLKRIDELVVRGFAIGLVASSAGAAAALNAYAARKKVISGVVLIAGKVNRPQAIGSGYSGPNPSFLTAAYDSQAALASLTPADRSRILTRSGMRDMVVPKHDSHIPGAKNRIVPSFGHLATIASQMVLGAPTFIHFIKKQATA
ncbi:MAG: hypothetical protein JWN38_378 [Candidatus Saccharibacteria bacterium]|nr:hypothetical protein [Candidatus Saccharibacteria bacterium]